MENSYGNIISQVARKTGNRNAIVRLILSEYARIVARELLKGNLIEFPYNFGTCQIICKRMTRGTIMHLNIHKKEIYDYFYKTGFLFKIRDTFIYELKVFATGTLVDRLHYILKNKLKKYSYVD